VATKTIYLWLRLFLRLRAVALALRRELAFAAAHPLPLGILEAFSRSRLPVLLAFFHARIACQESSLLQHLPKLGAEIHESTRDAMLDSSCLPMHTAALHENNKIELIQSFRSLKWLLHDHAVGFIEEILI
jgi:hypothetical protein